MVDPRRKDKQFAQVRRVMVADCYQRGLTCVETADYIQKKLGLTKAPGKKTIWTDRQSLLKEWKEERLSDMDDLVQLELRRIDHAVTVLWTAWEKSIVDHKARFSKQKGELPKGVGTKRKIDIEEEREERENRRIETTYIEKGEKEEINFGDPRFITEIRMQLQERRKLLGLYAPEKREVTGKDGKDLVPSPIYDLTALTPEEKAELLKIARKVERTE